MFELKTTTECELTSFTGRTQKAGKEDVPAVSFRLRITNAPNTLLDLLSPTMRLMAYAPVEGQEQLPDVEVTTPILRSPDMKTWKSDVVHEGWKLFVARGIGEGDGLQMESCKVDDFTFDFHQGGHVDCEFRVGTADLDEEGAGMLWGRQKRKVFVQVHAPEMPAAGSTEATGAAIDGTVGHPGAAEGQGSLLDATDTFAQQHGGPDDGPQPGDDGEEGDEGASPDDDAAAFEAGAAAALAGAGVKPARQKRAKVLQ